ncbi:LapA family protein [Parendozoicomonas haliclonae]|uniref:LapA family protein n=1 Tax=Parendozoicomonas haliclonae TaxID=1960125 RepID=UPI0013FE4518|nr:LapA family protein [Parendozoicomonas haliclonae]
MLFSGLILSNQQVVTVAIWGWITGPVELSTALFLAFLGGAVVAVTFGLLVLVRLLLRSRRLEKKLALSEKELQKLRVSALRGLAS